MAILNDFFYNLLVFFSSIIPGHYVWIAIVIITVLLRLAFYKSQSNMTNMQKRQKDLAPKLAEIKEKYKGDKQAEQKATLELYKAEGVNPLGSCLPMIAQMVVFIGFYGVFTKIGLGPIKTELLYSFTPHPDSLNSMFFGVDLAKKVSDLIKMGGFATVVGIALPLVTAGTQVIQSLQAKSLQPKGGAGDALSTSLNWQLTYLFPLMIGWISYTLAGALSIYWITQTVFMIVQQKILMKNYKPVDMVCTPVEKDEKVSSVIKKGDVVVEVREKK